MIFKTMITLILLYTSLYSDIYTKGEKIYSIMCDKEKVSALSYRDQQTLKKKIKSEKLCGNLNDKKLDALTIYLTSKDNATKSTAITVPEKSRCLVCGMFVDKYPKWAAMIEVSSQQKYYFDGVKDMMKFYFDPKKFHHDKERISHISVSDYYTLERINASKAYYVIGSNIYGPMGEELIPFKNQADAKSFLDEHHGQKILTFDMIQEQFLY